MTISNFFPRPYQSTCLQLLLALFLFPLLQTPSTCQAELVDRVVAVVNDEVITMSEVDEEGKIYFKKITDSAPAAEVEELINKAREEILNGLIDKYLIKINAKEMNITASDTEVQANIDKVMAQNNLSPQQFKQKIEEQGLSEKVYRNNVKNQILQKKLIGYAVHSKIVLTDDMILDYYDTNYTKHLQVGEYYLLQMGFLWGKDEESKKSIPALYLDKQEARKKATRVHALAKQGQDFRLLARKFSELPSAEDGGDIGVFKKSDMADYMNKAVTELSQGEISDIIETPAGFQFFKLLSDHNSSIVTRAPFESAKEEIREKLYQQKLQEEFKNWISKIRKKAYIQKM